MTRRGKLDHLLPGPERERAVVDAAAQLKSLLYAFEKAQASAASDEVRRVVINVYQSVGSN
jgi:hypothetical protein